MTATELERLTHALCAITEGAGREIMQVYRTAFAVHDKADRSPVTDADTRAENFILAELEKLSPRIPVVAEESFAAGRIPDISGQDFYLVDPLDGTKEFVSRNGEFTVNIALIRAGRPRVGVVHLPVLDVTYWSDGQRAWRRKDSAVVPIRCRTPDTDGLVVVASRSHRDAKTDEFLKDYPVKELIAAGSSLKLCRVAEGSADLYPRLGRTMEWDIASGHAVLLAAGGNVTTLDGGDFSYGKPGFDNPFFVARGLPS